VSLLSTIMLAALALVAALGGTVAYLGHAGAMRFGGACEAWEVFARACGTLRFIWRPHEMPRIEGTFRGVPVWSELLVVTGGPFEQLRSYETRVSAGCRLGLPEGFALELQATRGALERAAGAADVELGDGMFDAVFFVTGVNERACRGLLSDPAIRRTLLRLAACEPSLRIERGVVVIERLGAVTHPAQLVSLFDVASVAVLTLEHAAAYAHR
jgi:hypothetical protein